MTTHQSALNEKLLRSPAGHGVERNADTLVCKVTKRVYPIVEGNAQLYDDADVPDFLAREVKAFPEYVASSLVPDLNIPAERAYAEAMAMNTSFMFNILEYAGIAKRRIVELGAWRCEAIAKFANLGCDAYAVDFFPGMVNAAAKIHTGKPYHRLSSPMAVLPFQSGTIDLLYMHATLHHALPRRQSEFRWCDPHNLHDALCEVRRVLKPDGALFLMGEGVYPEGLPIADRPHERRAQAGETFYESWYTMSEYEAAFKKADIYPSLMSNQTERAFELVSYHDGIRIDLVKTADQVTMQTYGRIPVVAASNAGSDWPKRLLPRWIRLQRPTPNERGDSNASLWQRVLAAGRLAVDALR